MYHSNSITILNIDFFPGIFLYFIFTTLIINPSTALKYIPKTVPIVVKVINAFLIIPCNYIAPIFLFLQI